MKKIIFLVVFTFVFASCRWININNYGCTKEESQKVSEFAIPYWNKVQRVFDSASVNFGADSTLAKTDPKKVEQKYKQLFKSVFGEDPSVRYLTFGRTLLIIRSSAS